MTGHYPDLGSASDWLRRNLAFRREKENMMPRSISKHKEIYMILDASFVSSVLVRRSIVNGCLGLINSG